MPPPRSLAGNAYVLLALAALCWSGNHIVGRAAAADVPPAGIATLRWAIPALVLMPFAWPYLRNDWPLIRQQWRILVLLSLTGGTLYSALQYLGLRYTTALNVSVLNSLAPVMIAVVGAALFGDRLHRGQVIGIATSLLGVIVIVTKLDPQAARQFAFNAGDILIVFNMLLWGVYSVYLRRAPRIHWLSFAVALGTLAAAAGLPVMAWEYWAGWRFQPTLMAAAAIAYVAIFPSVIAYAAWNRGVELIGANRAGPFLHLTPIYSAVLAYLILGERLMAYHLIGFVLILAGVYFAARRQ